MGFLYEKLYIARQYATFAMPKMIKPNLNPAFEIRPYQERAFENFAFYFEDNNNPRPKPTQVLFHMATGSGKTLIMAGLILYLYKKGYRDFLFFVNLSNIVQKTKENFLNSLSSKFLFAKEVNIDGDTIPIKEVDNFQDSDPKAINICFTTTQGLHTDVRNAKENSITPDDFSERKVVLISDEAHHLNADTRRMNEMESESYHSWEKTVKEIFSQNADNVLLEFTATCDLRNANIKAEYTDKIIFNYPLVEFRKDGYSKEIMTLRTDVSIMDRALLAVVMSQYRLKVFQSQRLSIKPVVLFKARTVSESKDFMEKFIAQVGKLTAKDIVRLSKLVDNSTLKSAFEFFKSKKITADDLAAELRLEFSREHCISANDEKEAGERQLALNSLEDKDNPYRAIFEVKKLDEGWDVLNLFDIVRLYETRQGRAGVPASTTINEAQLIGRGSRYCPFAVSEGQDKYRRKYDKDAGNPLRICEELYYHCQIDPKYISELKNALREIGAEADRDTCTCDYKLKEIFKKDELYKCGVVFVNEQREKSKQSICGIPDEIKDAVVEYKVGLGSSRVSAVLDDNAETKENIKSLKPKAFTIGELAKENYAYVWRAMCRFPALRFDNLKKHFPNLESSREFVESKNHLGEIKLEITAAEIGPKEKCEAVAKALEGVAAAVEKIDKEYEGTKDFKPLKLNTVITDKTCVYTDPEKETEGLGVSQNSCTKWAIDLTKENWFAFEDNFGTTEEKSFVLHFRGLVDKLKMSFEKIWLVRNERQLCLFSFEDGRRFEPDYILFLKRKKNSKKTECIQVFVEPKGTGFIAADQWKEGFLLQLNKEGHLVFGIADTAEYRMIGCHFYNESDVKRKGLVDKEILDLCGRNALSQDACNAIGEKLKYISYLPLYSMEAACGKFREQKIVEEIGWMKVSGLGKKNKNLFVVQASGNSMEPKINDGDYCVFEWRGGSCDNNDVVLVQHSDIAGDETMGSYTIKKFVGKKKGNGYVSAKLVPFNGDCDEIKLKNNGHFVRQYLAVGVLRSEIKVVSDVS